METKRQHRRRLGLVFEPLEPRFLLSADLVPLDASLVSDPLPPVPVVYRALQPVDAAPQLAMQLAVPAREVVFVDGGIQDHARLAADFLRATGGEREMDVIVLDPGRDGVQQISEALAARRGLVAVHVLSHGADGAVALGATTLDSGALAARAETIGRWAQAFAADGDILFYGCDLAATANAEAFLADLARLTGADVAASSNLTGSRALGGDWDLEFATGAIAWTMPPLAEAEASWTGLLAQLDWDDPAVDWPAASLGPASFPVGGGNVTIQVQPDLVPLSTTTINNGSPDDDALVDQGGLAVTEQGLYVSATGFDVGESALITIDFSHPGGVSNVSFTIFDIDLGTFTDEVQAAYTASGAVTLTITDGLNNDLVAADTVRGIAGTSSSGATSGDANATFSFAGTGITQVALTYRNAGGVSGQSITLHDISFNVSPVAASDGYAIGEDATLNVAAAGILANDTDIDGPALSAVLASGPANAAAFTLNADGSFSYTPNADWNGVDTFTYRASDGTGESAIATVTITVDAVNDAPALALGANQTVPEDSGAQTVAGFATAAPGGGPDEAGQTFTYTVTNDNNALFAAQPSIAPNGTLTYTLAPNVSGAATVSLFVTDSGGTLNGGDDASPAQTFTIAVTPVADAPSLTVNPAAGNEDTAIPLAVSASLVDTDGSETLALTVSAIPIGATLSDAVASFTASAGSQTTSITGWNLATLSVLPPAQGDADFNLTVSATSTEAANGSSATVSANLAVTVDPVADAPALVVAPAAGNEDTAIALAIGVALVDTDGSESLSVELDALPVGAVLADGTNNFTASAGNQLVDITGWNLAALTVTPPANGDTDFPLTVRAISSEAGGGTAMSVANLSVDVLPVNDAPTVAAPAAIGVVEDVASPVTGIVFGDVDAGGNPATATFTVPQGTLSATAGGGVAVGGTVTALTLTGTVTDINAFIAAGNLRYATAPNDTTPVALTASLDDLGNTGAGGPLASPGANVTLNATPVNDAPVFGSLTLSVNPGGTLVLTSANLSATDVDDVWASLVFFIGNLQNGFFELVGNPGVAVTSFTQGQVGAGAVRFVQTDPFSAPSYLVFVTDGTAVVGPAAVALSFRPAVGVLPAPSTGRDGAPSPTVSFAATSLGTSSDDLGELFGIRFIRAPLVPTTSGRDPTTAAEENRVPTTAGARQAVKTLGTVAYPGLGFAGDQLPTSVPKLDFAIRPARHGDEPHGFDFSLDSARAAGIALSVGAAWWAGRASGLLSSLLASTPTWRHVDPLPVLGRDRDDPSTSWGEPEAEEEKQEEAAAGELFGGRGDDGSRA